MNILIIEDEPTAASRLKRLLLQYDPDIYVPEHLDTVEATVHWLKNNPEPDLILMDIQLADGICFDIFKKIKIEIPVIFCTAFDDYAIKAFKVNSVDYLLKPINEDELFNSLDKFKKIFLHKSNKYNHHIYKKILDLMGSSPQETKDRFLVKQGRKFLSVPAEKIAYVYMKNKVVMIVTFDNKQYPIDLNLNQLEQSLDTNLFFRVNRQEIVSIKSIKNIEKNFGSLKAQLNLKIKEEISISRKRSAEFREWLGG